MATGWERTGSTPWFGNPSKQELREKIAASLDDIVLEKPRLRGVTLEPLSDWRKQGFAMNQSVFSSAAPLKGPSRAAEEDGGDLWW